MRVPTAEETAESVRRAQRALQELKQRQAAETRHAEDEAQDEAARWHAHQELQATEHQARGGPTTQEPGHEVLVLDAFV